MVMTLTPAVTDVSQGLSVGIGGFGFGSSSGAVGVGVSAPVGGGRVTMGYAANGRVTDVRQRPAGVDRRRPARRRSSSDVNAQMGELSKTVFGAADKSGLF